MDPVCSGPVGRAGDLRETLPMAGTGTGTSGSFSEKQQANLKQCPAGLQVKMAQVQEQNLYKALLPADSMFTPPPQRA